MNPFLRRAARWLTFAALLIPSPSRAANPLTFEKDIRPILKAHCFDCHGEGDHPKGGLDLRLRRLIAAGFTQRTVRRDYRGLEVLDGTAGPAVLLETGFLSNPREAARLADGDYRRKMANAVAKGILDSLSNHP